MWLKAFVDKCSRECVSMFLGFDVGAESLFHVATRGAPVPKAAMSLAVCLSGEAGFLSVIASVCN